MMFNKEQKLTNFSQLNTLLSSEYIKKQDQSLDLKIERNTKLEKEQRFNKANILLIRLKRYGIESITSVHDMAVWELQCLAELANDLAKSVKTPLEHLGNLDDVPKDELLSAQQGNYFYDVKDALLELIVFNYPSHVHIGESFGILEVSIATTEAGTSCFHSPDAIAEKFDRNKYPSEIKYFEWQWSGIRRQKFALQIWETPRLRRLIAKATFPNKLLSNFSIKRVNRYLLSYKRGVLLQS